MVKKYDGMRAYVEECGPGWLHISSCMPRLGNFVEYEQLGIYHGNTDGVREGALIEIWFKHDKPTTIKAHLKEFLNAVTYNDINIVAYRLVKNGPELKGLEKYYYGWLRFLHLRE